MMNIKIIKKNLERLEKEIEKYNSKLENLIEEREELLKIREIDFELQTSWKKRNASFYCLLSLNTKIIDGKVLEGDWVLLQKWCSEANPNLVVLVRSWDQCFQIKCTLCGKKTSIDQNPQTNY